MNFRDIDRKWQKIWEETQADRVEIDHSREKFYILDMFPYPSGAGLHVGHPLGYIATDIYARFMKMRGYNVLHPMGFDAFGLPAEQYAIETGQHPAISTMRNIERYREQLRKMGLGYDWSREIITCDPSYYKWTQWIFLKFFNSWYNLDTDKAEPIQTLIAHLDRHGSKGLNAYPPGYPDITASEWRSMTEREKSDFLMNFRLIYRAEGYVNWCPALGTVLANEEVQGGLSERGGFPVYRKKLKQWFLRVTAFAERLLRDLDELDWPESLKEHQRKWIGKSTGAYIYFPIKGHDKKIIVFTTRPDTIYGVTFISCSPEYEEILPLVPSSYKSSVMRFVEEQINKSELDRLKERDRMEGVFTGLFAIHPLTGKEIPIYVANYVVGGYGTGAVMGVPGSDERDWLFARKMNLPVIPVVTNTDPERGANPSMEETMINSEELDGLPVREAIKKIINILEERKVGKRGISYHMRDAVISRQRYWGEPIPIYYKDGVPHPLPEDALPLLLPHIDEIKYGGSIEGPLASLPNWQWNGYPLETSTMPGWAGSSWYYLRYEDPHNDKEFASSEAINYWKNVDIYVGGAEHATGHLIYVRCWTKLLHDLGYLPFNEPARKLINQGLILGISAFVPQIEEGDTLTIVSFNVINKEEFHNKKITFHRCPIEFLSEKNELDIAKYREWLRLRKDPRADTMRVICDQEGKFICKREVEKMSKSRYNVINPDEIIEKYGADTFRLYEMFMGPIEENKPWDSSQIEGVFRFLKRVWTLTTEKLSEEEPTEEDLKMLHRTIEKVTADTIAFKFNTAISHMMVFINYIQKSGAFKKKMAETFIRLIAPYCPHIAEELWERLGHSSSVFKERYPEPDPAYLKEETIKYPVTVNGKLRCVIEVSPSISDDELKEVVLSHPALREKIKDMEVQKIIVVKGKIVNIVARPLKKQPDNSL